MSADPRNTDRDQGVSRGVRAKFGARAAKTQAMLSRVFELDEEAGRLALAEVMALKAEARHWRTRLQAAEVRIRDLEAGR